METFDLNRWEQENIECLTSKGMGIWLHRRDNRIIFDELEKIKKEILNIKLTSWNYDNKLYDVDGQTVQLKAIKIIDKYISEVRGDTDE